MLRRAVILIAIAVYLGIMLGCLYNAPAQSATDSPRLTRVDRPKAPIKATRLPGLPFRGVAMQLQRVDWINTEYRKSIDEIADLGADTVMFVVNGQMLNGSSSRIYIDSRLTPTAEQLGSIIDYAKGKNLRVVLMPIVLLDKPRGMEWRGTIKPDDWGDWWQSYRSFMYHFAWVAETHKVDLLVVGSELVSTESEQFLTEWHTTIYEVRKAFKGLITYSSNWDHYREVKFWDQLDLVGMNSYWKLGDDHTVPVDEIVKRWRDIQKNLATFQDEVGKPIVLLEAGWCSLQNAAHEPWDYTRIEVPVDLNLQKKLYEGFFRAWSDIPWFGGYMIWEWPPGDGGADNRGYTPEGKPAEKVLREWLAKPKWDVKP